ncbi:MAG: DUF983 domain-containing protein, partial [Opitutaceae bacterium]
MNVSRGQIFVRGMKNRCPNCGESPLFRRGFTLHRECPRCGLEFERGEGFFLGSMTVNYGLTILLFLVPVLLLGISGVLPASWAVGLAIAGAILVPMLIYRSSRSWWLMTFYLC